MSSSPPRPSSTSDDISEARARHHRLSQYLRSQYGAPGARNTPEGRRRRARVEDIQAQELNRLRAASHSNTGSSSGRESQAPTSALRSRPRAAPSELHLRRNRIRRQIEGDALSNSISTVQDAVDRLTEASSNLTSLLDEPIPRLMSLDAATRDWEEPSNGRRAKRRKLCSDTLGEGVEGVCYGYRGQVIPGPMKMEIVGCDGEYLGDSREPTVQKRYHWPENILRNDKSVYCTESNKCNILLRHRGESPFALKKLVIKAPETSFPALIQQGLIFVSMTSEKLSSRTSHYHLREASPPPPPPPPPPPLRPYDTSGVSRYELYSRDSRDYNNIRPPSRRADYPSARAIPAPISGIRPAPPRTTSGNDNRITNSEHTHSFPLIDLRDSSTPPPRTMSPLISPIFNVTTSCDFSSDDDEEESNAATLADRAHQQRESTPLSSSEDEDSVDREVLGWGNHARNTRTRTNMPGKIEWTCATEDEGADNEEQEKPMLAPHASFFIEKEKSMVSVKFDPPVSGKFILLKLWSPGADQSVDIQSIIAYGFVGPRFFAATEWI